MHILNVDSYRDGGTICVTYADNYSHKKDAPKQFYIDNRISTPARGSWWTAYPSDVNATEITGKAFMKEAITALRLYYQQVAHGVTEALSLTEIYLIRYHNEHFGPLPEE